MFEWDGPTNIYEVIDLKRRSEEQRNKIQKLESALKEAIFVFQHYGDTHRAKNNIEKAEANYKLAIKMKKALGEDCDV